jgi:hypothetical protein
MVGIVGYSHSENFRELFPLPSLLRGLRGPISSVVGTMLLGA